MRKVTEEFKEKIKKRHAKRILIKVEPDAVINLTLDDEAETVQSGENAVEKDSKEKDDTQQQPNQFAVRKPSRRNVRKPSRFIWNKIGHYYSIAQPTSSVNQNLKETLNSISPKTEFCMNKRLKRLK